jgi:hypothetical protein
VARKKARAKPGRRIRVSSGGALTIAEAMMAAAHKSEFAMARWFFIFIPISC